MNGSIFVDGKEFISAIRAAKKIGYAGDYIGQLARAKKLPAKLIGKSWYVDYSALVEHKKNRKLVKRRKVIAEVVQPKSLNKVAIVYEKEETSRLPELIKKTAKPIAGERRNNLLKIYTPLVLSLSLALIITVSVAKPEWLSPEPIKSGSGRAAFILATYREPALTFFAFEWLKNIFSKKKELSKTNELASNFDNQSGIVVFPETEDRIGISNRIKSIFSDNVAVAFDEDGDTGVIIPVFSSEDSFENYAFVIIPVPVKSGQTPSFQKVQ